MRDTKRPTRVVERTPRENAEAQEHDETVRRLPSHSSIRSSWDVAKHVLRPPVLSSYHTISRRTMRGKQKGEKPESFPPLNWGIEIDLSMPAQLKS